jgi:hypothetical protein
MGRESIVRVRRVVLVALVALQSWGCNDSQPTDWRAYSADGVLTFAGPPDLGAQARSRNRFLCG